MPPAEPPCVPRRAPRSGDAGSSFTVLDLFAGAGGLSEAFAWVGFEILGAVEQDEDAAATYAANFGDIVAAKPIGEWLVEDQVPEVDVVVGGPPCQGFSALGLQAPHDPRNTLWNDYVETVLRADPKYFVIENVGEFSKDMQYLALLAEVRPGGRLDQYTFDAQILNAADFGAPQRRRRTIMIGRRRDVPELSLSELNRVERHQTVREAFDERGVCQDAVYRDLRELARPGISRRTGRTRIAGPFRSTELHVDRTYSAQSLERFSHIPEKGNRHNLPEALMAPCWRGYMTGSSDVMGRLNWDKPSVTIRTEFTKPEKGRYLHPVEDRAITLYEGAVLQGFPDDYLWMGSRTSVAKQIGNAVPIQLGEAIAVALLDKLDRVVPLTPNVVDLAAYQASHTADFRGDHGEEFPAMSDADGSESQLHAQ